MRDATPRSSPSARSSPPSAPRTKAETRPPATVPVPARDGHLLAVDVHLPAEAPVRAVVVLAPAMGVKRTFYRACAAYLAEAGLAVLVPDYRGIGGSRVGSLRQMKGALHDWADLDLAAVVAHATSAFPGIPLHWIGHSVGGQLLGLLPDAPVRRAVLVAAQHGHWRSWPGWPQLAMAALWWVGIPTLTALTGRLPMSTFGQGEDLPPNVAREWARWGRDREYIVGYARQRGPSGFDRFAGALRSYAITDDAYAPPPSVKKLVDAYRGARSEYIEVSPEDLDVKQLGHFAVFRSASEPLWREWRDWLLADAPAAS